MCPDETQCCPEFYHGGNGGCKSKGVVLEDEGGTEYTGLRPVSGDN